MRYYFNLTQISKLKILCVFLTCYDSEVSRSIEKIELVSASILVILNILKETKRNNFFLGYSSGRSLD